MEATEPLKRTEMVAAIIRMTRKRMKSRPRAIAISRRKGLSWGQMYKGLATYKGQGKIEVLRVVGRDLAEYLTGSLRRS